MSASTPVSFRPRELQRLLNITACSQQRVTAVDDTQTLIGGLPHQLNLVHHQLRVHESPPGRILTGFNVSY
jgi:hypothetical protein